MKVPSVLFLLVLSLFTACSHAYIFYVGGREGWVLHPSESYADWAGRNRFQVNDTLIFKYTKGEDSVLEVSQQDFDQCNLNNPIQKMDTGFSVFIFNQSGPFYFISGTDDRCKQGQKLIIVVMAVRAENPITPLPPLPPSMAPTISPVAPPTVSPVPSPTGTPSPSPFSVSPSMNSPVPTPTITPAPSPFSVSPPMNSPVPTPTITPAPSPFSVSPPALTPTSSPTVSPGSSPSTQPSAPGSPTTPNSPNSDTANNPTGAAPGLSDFRASSVSFALVVAILNYGMFN